MFVVATLETVPIKNIVIPIKYLEKIDLSSNMKDGVNQSKRVLLFFNKDLQQNPNFSLDVKSHFDGDNSGCYFGHILKFFGKSGRFSSDFDISIHLMT